MELDQFQKELMNKTEQFLNEKELIQGQHYSEFIIEETEIKNKNKEIIMKIQLKNKEDIVKVLKKLGWKTDHKFYTNGQVNVYSNNGSKCDYGNEEMIQLYFR